MSKEPIMTINGVQITPAMACTIRVAIESFSGDLNADGLGDDDMGKKMTAAYQERINEIRELILSAPEG